MTNTNRQYRWYVQPLDARVNAIIAGQLVTEDERPKMLCADGKHRDLWACEYDFVAQLMRNRDILFLQFKIFNQEGERGKIRLWVFGQKRKSVKSAKKGIFSSKK